MTSESSNLTFVDTHAHLDDEQFDDDIDAVIKRANDAGVSRFINIGYEPARWKTTISLAKRFSGISFTLGLHPSESWQYSPRLIDDLGELAQRSGACAIGEVGIDLFREGPNLELQQQSFEAQIQVAGDLGLPVVIHQRAASDEVLAVLLKAPPSQRFILHSFEGNEDLLRLGASRGYFFGIGGLMTRRNAGPLREMIKEIPVELMLLETDSPYLVPAGVNTRRNEPANIAKIATLLSALLDIPHSDVADTTSRNAIDIFRLDSPAQVGATMS